MRSHRPAAWLSVLVTLAVAVLPAEAWANCLCAPGGCGAGTTSACCGASAQAEPPPTQSCCAAKKQTVKSHCCCTRSALALACQTSGQQVQGCECSPSQQNQAPAQPTNLELKVDLTAAAPPPLWATLAPVLDLGNPAPAPDANLASPPIPLRELYCVWRN